MSLQIKKLILIITFFLFFTTTIFAQDFPSIQTDRPDLTECPFIVPPGYFQFENGISIMKINENQEEIVAPSTLTKFGINNHFELRLVTEYIVNKEDINNISGINPVLIGFKTRLFEEKGILPLTSFIGHISIPKLASSNYKKSFTAPEFRFTMQHSITENQSLSYNLGAEWNGENAEPTFIYTITSGFTLSDKIGFYVEFYGFIPQLEKPDNNFDAGLTYLFNPNHQIDLSSGLGLSTSSMQHYFALGYSFRFKS